VLLKDGTITASNLDLQISINIDYDGEPLLLPHARLKQIVSSARCDEVTLAVDGNVCVVTAGRGTWRLPVENANEWPTWEPAGLKILPVLPAEQFGKAMRRVSYACDCESSRYALGGVLFEVSRDEGKCWLVATDGRRLSMAEMDLPDSSRDVDDAAPLIPKDAAVAIQRFAMNECHSKSAIDFQASSSEIVATFESVTVTARLLQGRFPLWRDVIKDDKESNAAIQKTVVSMPELKDATTIAAVVTSEQSKGVLYTFSADGVTLRGKSSEYGESDVTIDVVSGGSPVTIKLDPSFVRDWLSSWDKDDDQYANVILRDSAGKALFTCDNCTGVIMPLALD
jgi:DNA polymerase-3 subunit beta